jgi:hypothetical protein
VLTAIDFDNQPMLTANEIDYVRPDRELPKKFVTDRRRSRNASQSFISASVEFRRKRRDLPTCLGFAPLTRLAPLATLSP